MLYNIHGNDKHKYTLENINCVCRNKMSQKTHLAILYGSATARRRYITLPMPPYTHTSTLHGWMAYPIIIITITSPHLSSDLYLCMPSAQTPICTATTKRDICLQAHTFSHSKTRNRLRIKIAEWFCYGYIETWRVVKVWVSDDG